MPETPNRVESTIDPARGGRVQVGRVKLDFPAGVTQEAEPFTVNASIRDSLTESPYRGLYVVFDIEANQNLPRKSRKGGSHRVSSFARPVDIEIDIDGIANSKPLVISYWDERLGHWWRLPTTVDHAQRVARTQTWHFSSFGLGDDTTTPTPAQSL
jgi:hypothetical protein